VEETTWIVLVDEEVSGIESRQFVGMLGLDSIPKVGDISRGADGDLVSSSLLVRLAPQKQSPRAGTKRRHVGWMPFLLFLFLRRKKLFSLIFSACEKCFMDLAIVFGTLSLLLLSLSKGNIDHPSSSFTQLKVSIEVHDSKPCMTIYNSYI
jgi:hypothetical protein